MSLLTIFSPSTVSTMRTVPCIAGCDGPMLTVMRSGDSSGSTSEKSCTSLRPSTSCFNDCASAMFDFLLDRIDRQVVAPHERLSLLLPAILAQRIADELFVEIDPPQIRVALEAHAVHVERL